MKKKKNNIVATSKDGGIDLKQKTIQVEDAVEALQLNMQEIANFCAVCQTLMKHQDIQDPRILQCIFKALCLIEELTYCKGNGSLEYWAARAGED